MFSDDASPPSDEETTALVERARSVRARAYAPRSGYEVGAALVTADGEVFVGCNVENANYSNTLHAEEVAVGNAVAAGYKTFEAIAVSTATENGEAPCGMCLQTLAEFCDADLPILLDAGGEVEKVPLGDLLPRAFSF